MKKPLLCISRPLSVISVLLLSILLGSCAKSYEDLVPKDAKAIVRVPVKRLLVSKKLATIFASSAKDAIDTDGNAYGYITNNGYFGLLLPIGEAGALNSCLESGNIKGERNSLTGLWRADFGESWHAFWDSRAIAVMGPALPMERERLERIAQQMFLGEEGMTSGNLYDLLADDGDGQLVAQIKSLPQTIKSLLSISLFDTTFMGDDILQGCIYINRDKLVIKSKVQALAGKQKVADEKTSAQDAPKMSATMFRGSLLARHKCDTLRLIMSLAANTTGKRLLQIFSQDKLFGNMLRTFNDGIKLNDIIGSIKGDFLLQMPRMNKNGSPTLLMAAQLDNTRFLDEIPEWQHSISADKNKSLEKRGDEYIFRTGKNFFTFTVSGNVLLARFGDAPGLEPIKPPKSPQQYSCLFRIDTQALKGQKPDSGATVAALMSFAKAFPVFEFHSTGVQNSEFIFQLSQNLRQIPEIQSYK